MVKIEVLAVTCASEKFNYYLVGQYFEWETHHKPLVAMLEDKDLSKLFLQVQRFKKRMMRYDYTIFHTPGPQMYVLNTKLAQRR